MLLESCARLDCHSEWRAIVRRYRDRNRARRIPSRRGMAGDQNNE
jgi:hypothetical protein